MASNYLKAALITIALLVAINRIVVGVLFELTASVSAAKWAGTACGSVIVGLVVAWRLDQWARLRLRKSVFLAASILYVLVDPFLLALLTGRYMWSVMDAAAILWSFAPLVLLGLVLGSWIGTLLRRKDSRRQEQGAEDSRDLGPRKGATVMELLVVISIIGMVMALLLPAVMQSRATARRSQCANNLRNVGLAILANTEAKGRFPAIGYFGSAGDYRSWVVDILPRLERSDIERAWDFAAVCTATPNSALAQTSINVLTCAADDSVESGKGNLSFVVNAGIGFTIPVDCPAAFRSAFSPTPGVQPIDLNGNGLVSLKPSVPDGQPSDRDLFYQLSLFFIENWPLGSGTVRHHSLASVYDGASQTLMLSENVRAGYNPTTNSNWSWPQPQQNAFMLSGYICKDLSCTKSGVDYSKANGHSGGPWSYESINAALSEAEGLAPWPSSYHPAGVNVMFVDAHVRFLSQDVEGAVYASLATPQGTRVVGPLAQPPLGDDRY